MNRSDLIFIVSPFLLTALFVVFGYQILIRQTPEARITTPSEQAQAEILTDNDFEVIKPSTPLPPDLKFAIQSVPQNTTAFNQLFETSQARQANAIYLTIPVTIKPDHSLELANQNISSQENIVRWIKKTLSTAHQAGYHTALAMTLNASATISDLSAFTDNYLKFIPPWSALANEFGTSFFFPGITVGHPLYIDQTDAQISQLLLVTQRTLRPHFGGSLGVGLCCQTTSAVSSQGYNFIVAIPTPETPFIALQPLLTHSSDIYGMKHTFNYDRDSQLVTTVLN